TYPKNETVALRLDGTKPPLDDVRVRRAINYAIDRDGIVNTLYEGSAEPAAQLIPKGVTGFDPEREVWEYDPAEAERLLDAAAADGAPIDAPITIYARNAQFPRISEMTQIIRNQLSDIGLDVSIQMMETGQHVEYQVKPFPEDRGANVLLIQHGNQAGDASFTMGQYMRTDSQEGTIGDETLDELIDAANASGQERQEKLREAMAYARDEI